MLDSLGRPYVSQSYVPLVEQAILKYLASSWNSFPQEAIMVPVEITPQLVKQTMLNFQARDLGAECQAALPWAFESSDPEIRLLCVKISQIPLDQAKQRACPENDAYWNVLRSMNELIFQWNRRGCPEPGN